MILMGVAVLMRDADMATVVNMGMVMVSGAVAATNRKA
jgi:hypothetical protein